MGHSDNGIKIIASTENGLLQEYYAGVFQVSHEDSNEIFLLAQIERVLVKHDKSFVLWYLLGSRVLIFYDANNCDKRHNPCLVR